MTDDIVARLRDCTCVPHGDIVREAADEIERLRKERDDARRWITDLLFKGPVSKKKIAEAHGWNDLFPDDDNDMEGDVE